MGEVWLTRQIGPGHIFVTRSKTPYEVCHTSPWERNSKLSKSTLPWISSLRLWKLRIQARLKRWK